MQYYTILLAKTQFERSCKDVGNKSVTLVLAAFIPTWKKNALALLQLSKRNQRSDKRKFFMLGFSVNICCSYSQFCYTVISNCKRFRRWQNSQTTGRSFNYPSTPLNCGSRATGIRTAKCNKRNGYKFKTLPITYAKPSLEASVKCETGDRKFSFDCDNMIDENELLRDIRPDYAKSAITCHRFIDLSGCVLYHLSWSGHQYSIVPRFHFT